MTTVNYINASLEIWGCVMSAVVAMCFFINKRPHNRCDRLYLQLLGYNAGVLFFDMAALFFRGNPSVICWFGVRISNFIAFSCSYALLVSFSHYLTAFLEQRTKVTHAPLYVIRVISSLAFALIILTQFFPLIYYIDAQNMYQRGRFFWLSMVIGIVCLILNLWMLMRYRYSITLHEKIALWSYIVLPILAMLLQMFVYGIAILNLANTVSIVVVFLFLQVEQNRRIVEQENQLTQSRIAIMLSQIQPHFLYNALAVIQDMCHDKAPEAEQTTIEFAEFLRSNLDSLSESKPISFEKELRHTKNYLALEMKRFHERLKINYKIEATQFRLPAMTLQPLVENAVRYGVMKRESGGTIDITTRETETCYFLIVSDDGVGFDQSKSKEDGRTHIGISNVRDRVVTMCGGDLMIESIPGKGTTAIITIPKETGKQITALSIKNR